MMKEKPFQKMIEQIKSVRGVDDDTAFSEAQKRYDGFINDIISKINDQDSRTNTVSIQLTSHFALLSTLSLTVVGFLFQSVVNLTPPHKWIIVSILACQTISLTFGAIDYLMTIRFHQRWSGAYKKVLDEIDNSYESSDLQVYSDLIRTQKVVISDLKLPTSTPAYLQKLMVVFCLFGLLLLILLFATYLFDIPTWIN